MRTSSVVAGLVVFSVLLAACSSSSSGATHPAMGSGGAGGEGAGGACTGINPPAMVPTITGTLVQTDGTPATAPPKMTGGDAHGVWLFESLVAYLPPSTKDLVDLSKSSVTGSAWAILNADQTYQLGFHVDASASVALVGPENVAVANESTGNYTTSGGGLDPVSTCSTSSTKAAYEYTRLGPSGQILVHAMTKYGQVDLLLGGHGSMIPLVRSTTHWSLRSCSCGPAQVNFPRSSKSPHRRRRESFSEWIARRGFYATTRSPDLRQMPDALPMTPTWVDDVRPPYQSPARPFLMPGAPPPPPPQR